MKRWVPLSGVVLALMTWAAAAEDFSHAVRPEDFTAAGLSKLSPEELARLDALVRDYKSGSLAAAQKEAERAATARASAEARAAQAEAEAKAAKTAAAEQKQADAGRLAKIKQMLTPQAAVAIEPVESRIAGKFTGWEGRAIFTLENGEHWQVANSGTSYYTPAIMNPKVKITPAALGAFWMTIEEIDQRVKVVPLSKR
jgi:hypothetical protein